MRPWNTLELGDGVWINESDGGGFYCVEHRLLARLQVEDEMRGFRGCRIDGRAGEHHHWGLQGLQDRFDHLHLYGDENYYAHSFCNIDGMLEQAAVEFGLLEY